MPSQFADRNSQANLPQHLLPHRAVSPDRPTQPSHGWRTSRSGRLRTTQVGVSDEALEKVVPSEDGLMIQIRLGNGRSDPIERPGPQRDRERHRRITRHNLEPRMLAGWGSPALSFQRGTRWLGHATLERRRPSPMAEDRKHVRFLSVKPVGAWRNGGARALGRGCGFESHRRPSIRVGRPIDPGLLIGEGRTGPGDPLVM